MVTPEQVRAVLSYNPETGAFTRLCGPARGLANPKPDAAGYLRHTVNGRQYFAHRLAWVLSHGCWPSHEVDHINGDRADNRLTNLREATPAQNRTNSPAQRSSKVGLRGVHFHPGAGRYRAQICKQNKTRHIGYFDTAEEAHAAYLAAAVEVHGDFVRWP